MQIPNFGVGAPAIQHLLDQVAVTATGLLGSTKTSENSVRFQCHQGFTNS